MAELGCSGQDFNVEETVLCADRPKDQPLMVKQESVVRVVQDGTTTKVVLVGQPDTSAVRRCTCESVTALTIVSGDPLELLRSIKFKYHSEAA